MSEGAVCFGRTHGQRSPRACRLENGTRPGTVRRVPSRPGSLASRRTGPCCGQVRARGGRGRAPGGASARSDFPPPGRPGRRRPGRPPTASASLASSAPSSPSRQGASCLCRLWRPRGRTTCLLFPLRPRHAPAGCPTWSGMPPLWAAEPSLVGPSTLRASGSALGDKLPAPWCFEPTGLSSPLAAGFAPGRHQV